MNSENKPLERCCNGCPFLQQNANLPNPPGWIAGDNRYDWYTQKNIDRLWQDGLKHGDPMVCHSHDDQASDYGGSSAKDGVKKLCLGAVLTQFKHIKIWEQQIKLFPTSPSKAFRGYKTLVGPVAMTQRGLREFAFSVAIGRTDLIGGLPIPRTISEHRTMRNVSKMKVDLNTVQP